jgi:hypothetical protein
MFWIPALRPYIEISRRGKRNISLWNTFRRAVNYRLCFTNVEYSRFPPLPYFPVLYRFEDKKWEWEMNSRALSRNCERESSMKVLQPQSGVKGQSYDGRRRQGTSQWIMRWSGTEFRTHNYSLFPLSWIIQCFVLQLDIAVICSSFLVFAPDWAKKTRG